MSSRVHIIIPFFLYAKQASFDPDVTSCVFFPACCCVQCTLQYPLLEIIASALWQRSMFTDSFLVVVVVVVSILVRCLTV